MKVPVVNSVKNDVKNFYPASKRLVAAISSGYNIGKRTTSLHKSSMVRDICNKGRGVYRNLSKEMTIEDLPVFAGALGLLIPIYLVSPIFYIIGFGVKQAVMWYRSLQQKPNHKSNS